MRGEGLRCLGGGPIDECFPEICRYRVGSTEGELMGVPTANLSGGMETGSFGCLIAFVETMGRKSSRELSQRPTEIPLPHPAAVARPPPHLQATIRTTWKPKQNPTLQHQQPCPVGSIPE
jgi:hypothetical protein